MEDLKHIIKRINNNETNTEDEINKNNEIYNKIKNEINNNDTNKNNEIYDKIKNEINNNDTNKKIIITIDNLKETIDNNNYVKKCFSNEDICTNSLSYLISNINLSQSDKIKLGSGMEKILSDFIIKYNKNLKNIKTEKKLKKGEKEKDHLFKDEENKIIYYAELKSNLNLDTEKSKSTSNKCLLIKKELKEKYVEYTIKMYLVNLRYLTKKNIPDFILNKYNNITKNICGINEYFDNLNVKYNFINESEYSLLLTHLAKKMFNK